MRVRSPIYGLLAEFDDANAVVAATRQAYEKGYRRMDAYAPFPIEELTAALGFRKTRLRFNALSKELLGRSF